MVKVAATRACTVASSPASTSCVPRTPASTVAGTSGVGPLVVGMIEGSVSPPMQATTASADTTRTVRAIVRTGSPQWRKCVQHTLSATSKPLQEGENCKNPVIEQGLAVRGRKAAESSTIPPLMFWECCCLSEVVRRWGRVVSKPPAHDMRLVKSRNNLRSAHQTKIFLFASAEVCVSLNFGSIFLVPPWRWTRLVLRNYLKLARLH